MTLLTVGEDPAAVGQATSLMQDNHSRSSRSPRASWCAARWGDHRQLWVPVGFVHGFLTLSEQAEVHDKASGYWSKSCERTLRWDDPELAIAWPLERLGGIEQLLAEKYAAAPLLAGAMTAGGGFRVTENHQGRGTPRSAQILRTRSSLISVCLGMALRRLNSG